jgi:hypothetical protein
MNRRWGHRVHSLSQTIRPCETEAEINSTMKSGSQYIMSGRIDVSHPFLPSSPSPTMSQRTAAFFQAIFDLSSSIVLFLASFFALLLHGLRQVLTRRIPVKLTINEENSALVSQHSTTTIFEMIKERCPSLYGPQATFRPTWWLPGCVLSRVRVRSLLLTRCAPRGDLQTIWCVVAEMFYRDSIPYTR